MELSLQPLSCTNIGKCCGVENVVSSTDAEDSQTDTDDESDEGLSDCDVESREQSEGEMVDDFNCNMESGKETDEERLEDGDE